eukprot:7988603-Pyramimonas_sp.AAC.1
MIVAMLVTIVTTTTAMPATAPMVIAPATMTRARATGAREWPAWYYLARIVPAPRARARAFA